MAAVASPAAFSVLAAVLAAVGAIGRAEAVTASAAVILAFTPSGWWSGTGRGRYIAEALLVPAAFALTMVGGAAMRRMLVPSVLVLAAWASASAAWDRTPAARRPLLAACFGLSARAAVGLGLVGFGLPETVFAIFLSAAVPWAAARRWGQRAAELSALLAAAIPWQRWPVAAVAVVVVAILWGVRGKRRDLDDRLLGWLPGIGAAALIGASLAPWPGCPAAQILPLDGWPMRAGMVAVVVVTTRLRPGVAGAVWLSAVLALAPALAPTPEHRAFALTAELGTFTAPMSTGDPYVVEIDALGAGEMAPQTPLVVVTFTGTTQSLAKDPASTAVWRPQGGIGNAARWRLTSRHVLDVPAGVRPVLVRHPDLDPSVVVRIESIGPARPTPPRAMALPGWLLAAAVVVAAFQLSAATWQGSAAVVPWMVLVLGALAARAPVEPLHLLAERLAPDLALAAVLAAWLPAATGWLDRKRMFAAVAALLVPLALATPQLTPPMYGDEPFHLMLMGSLAEDHDFDVSDDLDLEEHPQNALYSPGWPLFHSPALGLLLLPGYVVAGRTGALVLLALMGGAVGALVARRARGLGVGEVKIRLLVVAMAATYPLATFATQIWSELPGAVAVAALLVLAARPRGGRLTAAVVAVVRSAGEDPARTPDLPVLAAIWLRRNRVLGVALLVAAVAAVSAVGWLTMGHPFGPYRRLRHLLPTDPALAVRAAARVWCSTRPGGSFSPHRCGWRSRPAR